MRKIPNPDFIWNLFGISERLSELGYSPGSLPKRGPVVELRWGVLPVHYRMRGHVDGDGSVRYRIGS